MHSLLSITSWVGRPRTVSVAARRITIAASIWFVAGGPPALAVGQAAAQASAPSTPPHPSEHGDASTARFTLSSPDLVVRGRVATVHTLNAFGCTGANTSPTLLWRHAPAETRSFAITVYDPDAPTGSGWWHWTVYNIPATATGLQADAGNVTTHHAPVGSVQGPTDFGKPGYGGPCPPVGDPPHHYHFTVYALRVPHLELPPGATAAFLGLSIHMNVLASASLVVPYGR